MKYVGHTGDGQNDRRSVGQTERRSDEKTDDKTDIKTDGGQMGRRVDGQTNR